MSDEDDDTELIKNGDCVRAWQDVRATKLVDMEGISRKLNINIRIFEPKTNSTNAPWRLVYGQNQCRKGRKDEILAGHCFYIKKMVCLDVELGMPSSQTAIYTRRKPDETQRERL